MVYASLSPHPPGGGAFRSPEHDLATPARQFAATHLHLGSTDQGELASKAQAAAGEAFPDLDDAALKLGVGKVGQQRHIPAADHGQVSVLREAEWVAVIGQPGPGETTPKGLPREVFPQQRTFRADGTWRVTRSGCARRDGLAPLLLHVLGAADLTGRLSLPERLAAVYRGALAGGAR